MLKGGYGPDRKAQVEMFHWLTLLGHRPVAQYVRVTGKLPTAVSGPVICTVSGRESSGANPLKVSKMASTSGS